MRSIVKSIKVYWNELQASLHVDTRRRSLLFAAALSIAASSLNVSSPAWGRSKDDEWLGTWATSPQSQSAVQTPRNFDPATTLRQIARTSIGGVEVRVRLSNELGTTPLVIGSASIALRSSGSAIVPGSDRPLTFSGLSSVTIPPGAPMLSDPVKLHVPPLSDLAVSIYLPAGAQGTTFHNVGLQTNYIAPAGGDYTSAVQLPSPTTVLNYFFLTGIEVTASKQAAAIVTLGDSITDGTRSTPDTNSRWPNVLALRLQERRGFDHLSVLNEGISGNRILSAGSGPNTLSRFDRDVLSKPGVKYMTLLIGINDIGNSARGTGPLVTVADIITGYRQIIERAHQHGITVYGATLTPIQGSGYDFPIAEANRQAVNHWIRTSGEFDAVIDFDAVTRDPSQPARFLPAYDSGDHLHPNDVGYKAMGEAIPLKLFRAGSWDK